MTKSNIQILFFTAFICLNIGLSLCQESSVNGSLRNDVQNGEKHVDFLTFLRNEGSIENIVQGHIPNYRFSITNNSLKFLPFNQNPSLYSGDPVYKLGLQSNNINDEDHFIIDVWVIGEGDVNASNINIRIPPQLVEGPIDIVERNYYLNISIAPGNKTVRWELRPVLILNSSNETVISRKIPVVNFYPNISLDHVDFLNIGAKVSGESDIQEGILRTYPLNWSYKLPEGADKKFYLYKIIFKVNRRAPPGDYSIKFDLFYKWRETWYVDSQSMPLHVNYIYEKPFVQILILIFALLGIFCQLDGLICRHSKLKDRFLSKIRSIWGFFF